MAKKEKEAKKEQKNKTPELAAAKKALETYFKENKLDPTKDWTKDKKHGEAVSKLVKKLNKERDKAAAKFPESDPKTMKRLIKKGENIANGIEKKAKEAKAEKKAKAAPTKYDYPLIDGREMTKEEKKKYRTAQRKAAQGSAPKETKAPKKEKVEAPKKEAKPAKEAKVKKDKKKVKEED